MQTTKTKATTRETATARASGTKPAADKTVALVAAQNDRFRRNIAWPAGFSAVPGTAAHKASKATPYPKGRQSRPGLPSPGETDVPEGRVVITCGIEDQGPAFVVEALRTIAAFDDFTQDCDPAGCHEMGAIEVDGMKVWFKIDLYDRDYRYGSDAPADPDRTRRVLTVLFPDEY